MNDRIRQISVVVLSIAQIITNGLSSAGVFFQYDVGEVANSFTEYFTPANLTFSVWGPIYLGLTLYAIYQALPGQYDRAVHRRIGWLAVSAAAANALWTPIYVAANPYNTAAFQPIFIVLSLVVMIWLLATLAAIFVRLRNMNAELTTADTWLVQVPFYGYFAWICVATVANVTLFLITLGWEGLQNGAIWSIVAIIAATLITGAIILYSRGSWGTIAYLLVLIWALVGIYLGNSAESLLVGVVALIAAAVLVVVAGIRFVNREPRSPERVVPSAA